jgi:hypothetical protein
MIIETGDSLPPGASRRQPDLSPVLPPGRRVRLPDPALAGGFEIRQECLLTVGSACRSRQGAVGVVGLAKEGCAQYVAIEANTAVEIPDRQAHVMYARYLRMAHFAVHGVDDVSSGDPNRAD